VSIMCVVVAAVQAGCVFCVLLPAKLDRISDKASHVEDFCLYTGTLFNKMSPDSSFLNTTSFNY